MEKILWYEIFLYDKKVLRTINKKEAKTLFKDLMQTYDFFDIRIEEVYECVNEYGKAVGIDARDISVQILHED